MSTFLSDTFTDTDGTALASHTGETGATWTKHGSFASGNIVITGNRARQTVDATEAIYYASGAPASADYSVTGVIELVVAASEAHQQAGVVGRLDTAAATCYLFVAYITGDRWRLSKFVAGVYTEINTSSPITLPADTPTTIKLEMVGTTIKGYVNGVEVCSATDSDISAAGKAGIYEYDQTTPTSDVQINSVSATDAGGADVTPPTITSSAIGTAGTTLVWTASEAITAGAGGSGGVTLSATNGAVTATYASGTGSTTVTYNLSRTIGHGETVTCSYTQPGNGWEDAAGNDLATFSGAAVTNGSNRPAAPTVLAVASVTASSVNLTWTDNADNETGFVVEYDTVNTFDQGPTDITINTGDTQTDTVLTLAASTTYYFRVKATNASGSSNWSNTVSGTTNAVGTPGGASFSSGFGSGFSYHSHGA